MWGCLWSSFSWWGLGKGLDRYKYVWSHLSPSGKFEVLESSFFCSDVFLLLPRCLVRGEGYGGRVEGLGPGRGPVFLLGLSDKAPPGKVASGMTVFLLLLGSLLMVVHICFD